MNQWIITMPFRGGRLPERIPFEGDRYAQLDCGPVRAWFRRDGRFSNDQLFASDGQGLAVCDGVVLNLAELKEEYGVEDFAQVLRRGWEETNGVFFKKLAGPFCGAVYDREHDTLTAYANQTGDTFVFYYSSGSFCMVSNDLNMIEAVMRENALPRSLDEAAALSLLVFGYMIDERTLFQEIKRVLPAEMVRFSGSGGTERSLYHRFSYKARDISFEDAVELVDEGFRKAVGRCLEKDREYGVQEHLADLSGGLDSRMTSWVAHDLGGGPLVLLNYCQSHSDELDCASRVAEALGGQFLHKQLDDVSFLYEIDRIVDMNYGLSVYFGITGGEQLLRSLNFRRFGLEHTGQIGDVVIGSFLKDAQMTVQDAHLQHRLKYSQTIAFDPPREMMDGFETVEAFVLYARAFMGALTTHMLRRHYTYAVSPFLDPDFFALCMSIPPEYRLGHKLYWAWIDKKYPEAGAIPSTHRRANQSKWRARIRHYKRRGATVLWKAGLLRQRPRPDPHHMNPLDYWYESKPELRTFAADYYRETRSLLDRCPETATNVDKMYASTTGDKLLALTLLAAVKRYFPPVPSDTPRANQA